VSGGHRALHELRSQGVIRAIGLGINEWETAQWLAERADLDVILLAGRYTLLEQGRRESFLPVCEEKGIGVIIGGPYNSGLLVGKEFYNYDAVPPALAERTRGSRPSATATACARGRRLPLPAAPSGGGVGVPGSQTRGDGGQPRRAARSPTRLERPRPRGDR
jgi:aryl-alcohol dehydrogenase-like predicted oxidoreductase